jgi:Cadherin domain
MSKISRYFIQPGVNFVDFSLDLQPDASLQGQTVVMRGSSLVDRVYVGHGLSVDFTASLGNTDLIFVAGTRADFTASLSGINLRLTHKSSPGTQITLGTGDQVIFADGWLSTTAMIDALKSGGTEPALNASLTASGTVAEVAARTLAGAQPPVSRVLGFASGTEGHTFGQVVTGMRLVLKGTPYADVVYVKPGTSVDFRNSLAGEDRVYLTGGWGDYTKVRLNSNSMRLSRGNEGVEVSVGDRLFFADGSVLVQPALTAIGANPNASTTDLGGNWDPTRTTPGLSVTPGTLALANFTDSGALANDFLSNDSTFDLSLTGSQAGTTAVYQVRAPGANTWTDLAGSAIVQVADGRYQYRVKVSDANGTTAYSNVLPANDGAIVIDQTAPVVTSSASATVLENAAAGSTVYTATATDAHELRFALKADNSDDASAFLIDPSTGVVTIKASPDFETQASYTFTVVATDAAGNATEQVVTLSVTNVDEVPPQITSSATATVQENVAAGSVVYTATATDTDAVAGSAITYGLKPGGDAAAFHIDPQSGAVRIIDSPDFEDPHNPDHEYTFTVLATDAAGNSAEKTVTLRVTDVAVEVLAFTSPATASVPENVLADHVVYRPTLSAPADAGTITYALKSDNADDAGAFSIDEDTGVVRIVASPDFEDANNADHQYTFTVVATDGAGQTAEKRVTLSVTNVDDTAPVFSSSGTATAIAENVDASSKLSQVSR